MEKTVTESFVKARQACLYVYTYITTPPSPRLVNPLPPSPAPRQRQRSRSAPHLLPTFARRRSLGFAR